MSHHLPCTCPLSPDKSVTFSDFNFSYLYVYIVTPVSFVSKDYILSSVFEETEKLKTILKSCWSCQAPPCMELHHCYANHYPSPATSIPHPPLWKGELAHTLSGRLVMVGAKRKEKGGGGLFLMILRVKFFLKAALFKVLKDEWGHANFKCPLKKYSTPDCWVLSQ